MNALGVNDLTDLKDLKSYISKLKQAKKKYEELKALLKEFKVDKSFIQDAQHQTTSIFNGQPLQM